MAPEPHFKHHVFKKNKKRGHLCLKKTKKFYVSRLSQMKIFSFSSCVTKIKSPFYCLIKSDDCLAIKNAK